MVLKTLDYYVYETISVYEYGYVPYVCNGFGVGGGVVKAYRLEGRYSGGG